MSQVDIPISFPNQISEKSWLREDQFKWFADGFEYALTQNNAIPALSQATPEQIFHAVAAIMRGAKKAGHSLDEAP